MTITDLSTDGLITAMLERIDTAFLRAEGPSHSERDVELKIRRPEVQPTAAEWRHRIEAAILGNPGLRPAELAEIAKVTAQTIRVHMKRMKAEGRI